MFGQVACHLAGGFVAHAYVIIISRRQPGPPPFPYTTLFRSAARDVLLDSPHGTEAGLLDRITAETEPVAMQDRKSTRLNSSHVAISYAVFCLNNKSQGDEHQSARSRQRSTREVILLHRSLTT